LGSIHIFALAHVIRRPIIVYADEFTYDARGNPIQACDMRGIYIPIALFPEDCCKTPIMLAFSSGVGGMGSHFTALTGYFDKSGMTKIPLCDNSGKIFKARYTNGDWLGGLEADSEMRREQLISMYFNVPTKESHPAEFMIRTSSGGSKGSKGGKKKTGSGESFFESNKTKTKPLTDFVLSGSGWTILEESVSIQNSFLEAAKQSATEAVI